MKPDRDLYRHFGNHVNFWRTGDSDRMKRAKTLLKNGNMTVENISHAVGYQNVENFSRQFKKEFSDDTGAVPQPEPCFLNLFKDFVISWKNRKKCVKL